MFTYIYGQIRLQFLTEGIVRVEKVFNGCFTDDKTYFVPCRDFAQAKAPRIINGEKSITFEFSGYEIVVKKNAKNLSDVSVLKNGGKVFRCKKTVNSGSLPPLDKTPQVFSVADNPRIIINSDGEKTVYNCQKDVSDIYLILCDGDFIKLRSLYVKVFGRCEFVRLSTLGYWNSKYYAYSESTAKRLIEAHFEHNVPLDNMVIDTDWRKMENGIGYDVNEELFPDMKGFLDYAHSRGVEIMFNDHPEPLKGATSLLDEKEESFRKEKLTKFLDMGLDVWWYDRNWCTKLISPLSEIHPESLGMYEFFKITEEKFKQNGSGGIYRRPVIMANVDNVFNGEYFGINDSATHRYSIQWTGDIGSDYKDLKREVKTLIHGGNDCIAYINADCGGHTGNPDKECFIRWNQFGAFSPVYRPHCTNTVLRTREPWAYDTETEEIVKNYVYMRYNLMPLIYKSAYENYIYGTPVFKSPGYNFTQDKRALKSDTEYMLGKALLIAPFYKSSNRTVEKRYYASPVQCAYYNGCDLQGDVLTEKIYDSINFMWNHVKPEKEVPIYNFSARYQTTLKFDKDVELFVESDDGCVAYIDGELVLEDRTFHAITANSLGVLCKGREYKIMLEYFQGGGEAAIKLVYKPVIDDFSLPIYLPDGEWIDAFNGKTIVGNKIVKRKKLPLSVMPIYIRKGAVIPLSKVATCKNQSWKNLTLEIYPSEKSFSDYIYEDDGETTAYKQGKYKITNFSTFYKENVYTLKIDKPTGSFKGKRNFKFREFLIKYNLIPDMGEVKAVYVNGVLQPYTVFKKDKSRYPFNNTQVSRIFDTLAFTVKQNNAPIKITFVYKTK